MFSEGAGRVERESRTFKDTNKANGGECHKTSKGTGLQWESGRGGWMVMEGGKAL